MSTPLHPRVTVEGKFLSLGEERFLIKGVTYGTFAPDSDGHQFPSKAVVERDFTQMRAAGINTVRTYTTPTRNILDLATELGLRLMIGLPWSQHVAFLDDARLSREIRRNIIACVRELADHPAVLLFALGNEIPASVVRWHGQTRVERFLHELYYDTKAAAPEALLTYVNYPPTEYLSLPFLDVSAFNVYLHREPDLRRYLARLQHLAGHRPLLLAEAGADSQSAGEEGQATITDMQLRAAFSEGACGAIVFAWTDEWWRGGHHIEDWSFGLVDTERRTKPAHGAVRNAFETAPFTDEEQRRWPKISVVVCAYNEASTIEECLTSLENLTYPNYELILVNDGSSDATSAIARRHTTVTVFDVNNGGLSAARNIGLDHATGDIVAYTDGDVRVDRDWLTFLVQPFLTSDVVGAGGANVAPLDDPPMAQCIARAPGSPTQVMLDDRIAEHVPGCNMAFRRNVLLEVGGFNPIYLRAGDDVDICWRLQARGWKIGFAPSALVWHRHRSSVRAYWKQQVGYGEGESWLKPHHPDQFDGMHISWHGRIYGPLPFHRSLTRARINSGPWGTASFPSVYNTDTYPFAFMPHRARWQLGAAASIGLGTVTLMTSQTGLAVALLGVGLGALATTIARCARYARATDIERLPNPGRYRLTRTLYRTRIAVLYFVQPLARAWGRLRGALSPPEVNQGLTGERPDTSALPLPPRATWAQLRRRVTAQCYWSETWIGVEALLSRLTTQLKRARELNNVEVDDGWRADRDVSVGIGAWAWIHLSVLVEDHGSARCLVRIAQRVRPTPKLWLTGSVGVTTIGMAVITGQWTVAAAVGVVLSGGAARAIWQYARSTQAVDAAITDTAGALSFLLLPGQRAMTSTQTPTDASVEMAALSGTRHGAGVSSTEGLGDAPTPSATDGSPRAFSTRSNS